MIVYGSFCLGVNNIYWVKNYTRILQYRHTSTNQHGDRYKRIASKQLSVATVSCKSTDTDGLLKLILLSHTLDAPVRYNFDEQEAYIEVISKEAL